MTKSYYENIPLKIKQMIGNYAAIHAAKAAINRFVKICMKFSPKIATLTGWK